MSLDDMPGILRDYFERKRCCRVETPASADDDIYLLISKYVEGTAEPGELEQLGQLCRENPAYAALLTAMQHKPAKPQTVLHFPWRSMRRSVFTVCACAAALILVLALHQYGGRSAARTATPVQFRGESGQADHGSQNQGAIVTRGAPGVTRSGRGVTALALTIDDGTCQTNTITLYQRACALLVGIDAYDPVRTGLSSLKEATNDVRKVAGKLGEFQFDTIEILENAQATRHNMLEAAERLMRAAGPDGAFLLYFAGHGLTDTQRVDTGYFVPYDGAADAGRRAERNVSNHDLRTLIERTKVKHSYIIADCCYAGLFRYRADRPRSVAVPDYFYLNDVTSKRVTQVLSAVDDGENSVDGAFADAFINALDRMPEYSFIPATRLQNDIWSHVQSSIKRLRGEPGNTPEAQKICMTPQFARYGGGGEFIFARTNQAPLVYRLPQVVSNAPVYLPGVRGLQFVHIADLDGNHQPQLLYTASNMLRVVGLDGAQQHQRRFAWPVTLDYVADINHDSCAEICVSYGGGYIDYSAANFAAAQYFTNMFIWVLDNDLNLLKTFTRHDGNVSRNPSEKGSTFIEVTGMRVLMAGDINNDRCAELLAYTAAGYGRTPRYLCAFDYETGRERWLVPLASPIGEHFTSEPDPATGMSLLLFGASASGNGARLPDGTEDDLHAYLRLIRGDGTLLWRKQLGSIYTGLSADFLDLDRNGTNEIVTWANAASAVRTNIAAKLRLLLANDPAAAVAEVREGFLENCRTAAEVEQFITQLENENGMVNVFDHTGNLLQSYTNQIAVKSLHVLPDYVQGEETMLLALDGGALVLLDARLNERRRINLSGTGPGEIIPWVKGMLRTRFGEYVVVLQYCKEEPTNWVGRIQSEIAPPITYSNIHIKLLNKKTLATEFTIPLADKWVRNDGCPVDVKIYNVDNNDDDELIVLVEEQATVYRLAERP